MAQNLSMVLGGSVTKLDLEVLVLCRLDISLPAKDLNHQDLAIRLPIVG